MADRPAPAVPPSPMPHARSSTLESSAAVRTLTSAWSPLARSIDTRSEWMVEFRRRLHSMPEPSGRELATTAQICQALREGDLDPRIMAGDTGIVVDLDLGAPPGCFIALRSELDGVGVDDVKPQPYASARPGLCHACGHDAHSTINLTAALTLRQHRDALRALPWRHNLRFIFQPAEETGQGARSMIEQGALRGVQAIIAVHVEPFLDAGTIGVRHGPMTAACKTFQVLVRGQGGHSARPHQAVDPIAAAVNLVSQFYQLCPRSIDGRQPLALTVGSIAAGHVPNAIPDEARLGGTLRTMRLEDANAVERRMAAIGEGVARATGCTIQLEFAHICPPTDNDAAVLDAMIAAAGEIAGPRAVTWIDLPSMGGEDFAFYQQVIPGAFVRLGAGLGAGQVRQPLHSGLFDIDEACLPIGAKLMARTGLMLAAAYAPAARSAASSAPCSSSTQH